MSSRSKCLLLLLAAAVLWSSAGVIIKSVSWNPLALVSYRSMWAAPTLILLARSRGRVDLSWPDLPQWCGAFFLALVSFCFVGATQLTTAANAILLQYTAPVWVALLAPLLLKEKTNRQDWFFIGLTFGGLALFLFDSLTAEGLKGLILGLSCGLSFGGLALCLRRTKPGQNFKLTIYGNFIALFAGLFFWRAPWPSSGEMALLAAAGIFQFGLGYYLFALASQGVSSLEMVLVTAVEPILNPLWVFLIIGERPGFWTIAGGAVVLTTITVWSLLKSRDRVKK